MTAPDADVWEDIKHAYIHGRETVPQIAVRFRCGQSTIRRRCNRDRWPLRSAQPDYKPFAGRGAQVSLSPTVGEVGSGGATSSRPVVHPDLDQPLAASAPTLTPRAARIARIYATLDTKLAQIATHIVLSRSRTLADSERETRMLGVLIRNLEKITQFEATFAHPHPLPASAVSPTGAVAATGSTGPIGPNGAHHAGAAARTVADAGADADRWRREIAGRLAGLQSPGA